MIGSSRKRAGNHPLSAGSPGNPTFHAFRNNFFHAGLGKCLFQNTHHIIVRQHFRSLRKKDSSDLSFVTFRKLPLPWGNEDTPRILETLKKHNVKVTFFMTGGWVESYPEDVRAILADGHDLGNHSENHKNMSQLSDEQCQEELMKEIGRAHV